MSGCCVRYTSKCGPRFTVLKSRKAKGTWAKQKLTTRNAGFFLLLSQDRERLLRPVYQQVALRFADLHDTPQRMAAKGVIAGIVPWESARARFYKRLRRRLAEVGCSFYGLSLSFLVRLLNFSCLSSLFVPQAGSRFLDVALSLVLSSFPRLIALEVMTQVAVL